MIPQSCAKSWIILYRSRNKHRNLSVVKGCGNSIAKSLVIPPSCAKSWISSLVSSRTVRPRLTLYVCQGSSSKRQSLPTSPPVLPPMSPISSYATPTSQPQPPPPPPPPPPPGGCRTHYWEWSLSRVWNPLPSLLVHENSPEKDLRYHSRYGLVQWEEVLHSNTSSHWLSPYPGWSLSLRAVSLKSYLYRSHCGDKMIVRSSYLFSEISFTDITFEMHRKNESA